MVVHVLLVLVASDEWDSISKEGKDLVRQMLQVDARKRISASKALEHPWLASGAEDMSTDQAFVSDSAQNMEPHVSPIKVYVV